MVLMPKTPALRKLKQENPSLGYIVSSRSAWNTKTRTCIKKKQNKTCEYSTLLSEKDEGNPYKESVFKQGRSIYIVYVRKVVQILISKSVISKSKKL